MGSVRGHLGVIWGHNLENFYNLGMSLIFLLEIFVRLNTNSVYNFNWTWRRPGSKMWSVRGYVRVIQKYNRLEIFTIFVKYFVLFSLMFRVIE